MGYICRVCGCEIGKYRTICNSCQEREFFNKAKKVKYSEYGQKAIYDINKCKYYANKEQFKEDYVQDGQEYEYPDRCFGCIEIPFEIDIDNMIEVAKGSMLDIEFDINRQAVDFNGLINYIKEWNDKQTAISYYTDYDTVVLVDE